jgi:hypothetical protein
LEPPIQFLLIARERLRPGCTEAYNQNEMQLAVVCAALHCPHPYLALVSMNEPLEVWWLNAFSTREERDALEPAYARNERLIAAMRPLGRRKEDFRESFTSTMSRYRQDLSAERLRIAGSRFLVISTTYREGASAGAVFESAAGDRFVFAGASGRAGAEEIVMRSRPGAAIFAVQPQWSFPAEAWIDADPGFWKDSAVVRGRMAPGAGS